MCQSRCYDSNNLVNLVYSQSIKIETTRTNINNFSPSWLLAPNNDVCTSDMVPHKRRWEKINDICDKNPPERLRTTLNTFERRWNEELPKPYKRPCIIIRSKLPERFGHAWRANGQLIKHALKGKINTERSLKRPRTRIIDAITRNLKEKPERDLRADSHQKRMASLLESSNGLWWTGKLRK